MYSALLYCTTLLCRLQVSAPKPLMLAFPCQLNPLVREFCEYPELTTRKSRTQTASPGKAKYHDIIVLLFTVYCSILVYSIVHALHYIVLDDNSTGV